MSVNRARARLLSRVIVTGGSVGLLLAAVIVGVAGGVKLERKKPTIQDVSIANTVHAGDNLAVYERISVPDGCLPRGMRMLCTERSCSDHYPSKSDPSPYRQNLTQLLTDSAVVASGEVFVPVPRDTFPGRWFYHEIVSNTGCGAFSGIFKPDATEVHDRSGQIGVAVTVLAWSPVPEH